MINLSCPRIFPSCCRQTAETGGVGLVTLVVLGGAAVWFPPAKRPDESKWIYNDIVTWYIYDSWHDHLNFNQGKSVAKICHVFHYDKNIADWSYLKNYTEGPKNIQKPYNL